MTDSANGEDIYDGLLRTVLGDTFTPLEWEGFKVPYDGPGSHGPNLKQG